MDVVAYNRQAWNKEVETGNPWTIPVTSEQIGAARKGEWSLVLTPTIPVPRAWYPEEIPGCRVLCLASGGGQQGPILAAAGARVTVFDNSPAQLAQDRLVAERDRLELDTVQGDMADMSVFPPASFDLIFHPISNVFARRLQPVWDEAFRVLRPGGILLAGFMNPAMYIFDYEIMENQGKLEVSYSLPYSDLESLPPEKLQRYLEGGHPLEYSHTLDDQIGGQLRAGFVLTGFFEDILPDTLLSRYMKLCIATRAIKPG
jgi:SAM-dependent methyltransferase